MRPRALDLFCGGGGVSEGLLRVGFDVVGVDLDPKRERAYKRGPGNPERHERPAVFVQADALEFPAEGFAFIWASPPCQAYSALRPRSGKADYPDLVAPTRERLKTNGAPWVIENVPGAPLKPWAFTLCGGAFGLGALCRDGIYRPLRRHRRFESSIWGISPPACACKPGQEKLGVYGDGGHWKSTGNGNERGGYMGHGEEREQAMGIDWMTRKDLSQAIPPAYAEWIGRQALEYLTAAAPPSRPALTSTR